MNWYIRFCLGLPARASDIEEVYELLPELKMDKSSYHDLIQGSEYKNLKYLSRRFLMTLDMHNSAELLNLLHKWLLKSKEVLTDADLENYKKTPELIMPNNIINPVNNCPFKIS